MIYVTRLNHIQTVLNSQLIEYVESTPDTVISLTNGEKLMVLESADEIVSRVVEFQRRIHEGCHGPILHAVTEPCPPGGHAHGGR